MAAQTPTSAVTSPRSVELPRYADGRLIDHHCHGLITRELDRSQFEALLNESTGASKLGTSVFDSMLGLAVRRHCAPLLGLDPLAEAQTYVARRQELGHIEVARRLMSATGVSQFVVDTGYLPEPICGGDELAELTGSARAHEVVRLEHAAEQLLAEDEGVTDFSYRLRQRLKSAGAVGAKSIAAYRVGLALPDSRPTDNELASALRALQPSEAGGFRIADPVVNGFLAWTAIELGMPLQFHVGYGDSDVDLLTCDPLLLTAFLRSTEDRGIPVMLLHNYPFHRHASYLAQVFDHVFMDVGLAVHNAGAMARTLIAESLELVPFGKMLYSSDAFGLPELYVLGAGLFRRGLSSVLSELVDAGEMDERDAARVGSLIGADNARRAYGLPPGPL